MARHASRSRASSPSASRIVARVGARFVCVSAVLGTTAVQAFDHGRWQKILEANVTEEGWVDYKTIRSKWAGELKTYLRELGDAKLKDLEGAREKQVFWINAYNAYCVQKLIDHKLPKSVPHAKFFGKNIFTERTYRIAGKVRSLDDIEHGILRKNYKDNRVHAALVCGASSCPRLRKEAYTAEKLDRQLDEEAKRWVQMGKDKNGKRKNRLDRKKNIFYVSKIFDWFEEDFGGNDKGVLAFLKRHSSESDRTHLEKNRVKISYLSYDWALNSRP